MIESKQPQQQEKGDPFGRVCQTSYGWIFVPKGEAVCISNSWKEIPVYTKPQQTPVKDIPEGYALVPIDPTDEMIEAGWTDDEISLRQRWKAMLEAAPEVKP